MDMKPFILPLLLICSAFTTQAQVRNQPLRCDFNDRGGTFKADPNVCTKFYRCTFGRPQSFTCPPGTSWNANRGFCDTAFNPNCNQLRPNNPRNPKFNPAFTTRRPPFVPVFPNFPTQRPATRRPPFGRPPTRRPPFGGRPPTRRPPFGGRPPVSVLPRKTVAFYLLMADETISGYGSRDDWNPRLHPYQQRGANMYIFTFINPITLTVPRSFATLARSKGTNAPGAVPSDAKILFSIGGFGYSKSVNPWPFLTARQGAEAAAKEVSTWRSRFGCDGVDFDLEEGAGEHPFAGRNLNIFLSTLKRLDPGIIVHIPSYGFPRVSGVNQALNENYGRNGNRKSNVDAVGIMVYEGATSLNFVDNFLNGKGGGLTARIPSQDLLVGCKGAARKNTVRQLTSEIKRRRLGGMIVWYASVIGGFQYEKSFDVTESLESRLAFTEALNDLKFSRGDKNKGGEGDDDDTNIVTFGRRNGVGNDDDDEEDEDV